MSIRHKKKNKMRVWWRHSFFVLWIALLAANGSSSLAAPAAIPAPLEPWRDWVLDQHRDLACPPQYANLGERFCRWSGQLMLQADEQGAAFTQTWQVYNDSWVTLPGDAEYWPQAVTVDGRAAVVVERDGAPSVQLTAGEHRLQGQIRWSRLPPQLRLPPDAGLLALTLRGKPVAQASVDAQNNLLFGDSDNTPATVADALEMQVYRQVQDGIPLQMETVLRLRVAGRDREVLLGQYLLDGFVPLSFDSPLPARVEKDGRLRVQLRAGEWELVLRARAVGQPVALTSKKLDPAWPDEEIWSFRDDRRVRQVTPVGPAAMDPAQTNMPAEWRQSPAWLMRAGEALQLTEIQRGDVNSRGDTTVEPLALQREFWLDFDGAGMTSRDTVSGALKQAARFSVLAPQQLGRVDVNGSPQLITRLAGQSDESGVELRPGVLRLLSVGRIEQHDVVPVSVWQRDMNSVAATLYLPPGWMLLHAGGVDRVVGSWLAQWNLWAIFLVLIVTAASARFLGAAGGVLALLALVLSYQASNAPLLLWLVALVGLGLLRALPEGRLRRVLSVVTGLVFVVLVLALLDFAVLQARSAVYPQLELGQGASIQQGGSPQGGVVGMAWQAADQVTQESEQMVGAVMPASAPVVQQLASESVGVLRKAKRQSVAQGEPVLNTGYDPNAKIQTGPGEPQWRWLRVSLGWSGPVMQDQQLRLYLLSPKLHQIWRMASVLLVFVFAGCLLRATWPAARWGGLVSRSTVPLVLLGLLLVSVQPARAVADTAFPSEGLLTELEQRLTRQPECAPQCAAIQRAQLQIDGNQLRLSLQVDAASSIAIPLPASRNQWQPRSVLLDGINTTHLRYDNDGVLWLALAAGTHDVVLEGALVGDNVSLSFPMPLHNVATAGVAGWQITGLQDGRVSSGSVQFTRDSASAEGGSERSTLLPDVAPPFLRITRTLRLGLDWQVQTTVERLAPAVGAIHVAVPLLTGEAVLTSGIEVSDGKVQVAMEADAPDFTWTSSLKQAAELKLTAATDVPWVEQWQWEVAPIWHINFTGLNSVKQDPSISTLPSWQPWPGESLTASISRPDAVTGDTRTVESMTLDYRPGVRAADTQLTLQVRSSQGGELPLTLPAGASLQRVALDGVEQSHSALLDGKLTLPLRPGSQRLDVAWRQEIPMDWRIVTPSPQLDGLLSNIHLALHVPEGRWLLAVGGPAMGPALLYWGVLVIIVLAAIGLGRMQMVPVATWQWLLLGVGMSTINSAGSVLVVVWFVAMARRRAMDTRALSCGNLQLLQVSLAILSVLAFVNLIGTIPASLLSSPDMQVVGNQSTLSDLSWYQDRSVQGVPTAWVISLPMWAYRTAMLLWSLWLVFALMTWCRWGWQCFSAGEWWRSALPVKKQEIQNAKE